MQAVTVLLISAAMAGGADWPDDSNSYRSSAPVRANQGRGNQPPSLQPNAPIPAPQNAAFANDFDAAAQSTTGSASRSGRRRQRTIAPTEYALPDVSSVAPPVSRSGQPPQNDRLIVPPLVDQGRGSAANGSHEPPDFAPFPTSDGTERESKRTYIPPGQSNTANSQFASPPVQNPPPQIPREQAFPDYSTTQNSSLDPRVLDQGRNPQYSQPGNFAPQYAPATAARRPLEPIYSAQNPAPGNRSNPIESVSNTVGSAAQATRQTIGDSARRVGAALDAGAQSVVRESERQGNSQFLTLLTLFGSIGLNLYLGWIAWDTYNRYQDLVADIRYTGSRRGADYEGHHESKAGHAEPAAY